MLQSFEFLLSVVGGIAAGIIVSLVINWLRPILGRKNSVNAAKREIIDAKKDYAAYLLLRAQKAETAGLLDMAVTYSYTALILDLRDLMGIGADERSDGEVVFAAKSMVPSHEKIVRLVDLRNRAVHSPDPSAVTQEDADYAISIAHDLHRHVRTQAERGRSPNNRLESTR